MHRFASPPVASVFRFRPLAGALVLALALPAVHAATLGHSHLVSVLGQPLQINVQLRELTADDQRSLEVASAPAQAWAQSGLTPPVDPASLRFHVADGYAPGTKVIQVRSAQTFDQPVADLLLDVNTAAGRQRFQVSLLTQSEQAAIQGKSASAPDVSGSQQARATAAGKSIKVKWGDTMFSIAQQHAVPGVTVYQMMIALQRANPNAFINSNLNLVKSGATLKVPGMAALTAISDREARRLFVEQAQAFALYSQRTAGAATAAGGASAASGTVTTDADGVVKPQTPGEAPHDQLRLSGGANGSDAASANASADDALSARKGIEDSSTRLSQLEGNVRDLNKALQAQGDAAGNLVLEGARSIGDTFSAGPGTQGAAGAGQVTANASSGSDQASTGQAAAGGPSAGAAAGKDGVPHDTGHNSVGSGQVGAGAVAAGAAASGQAGADNGGAGVAGTADNTSSGVNATGTAAAAAGVSATNAGSGSTAGSGAAGSGAAGSGTAGSGTAGSGTAGSGTAGSGTAGSGTARSGTAGSGTAGSGTAGSGTAGSGTAGTGTAGTGTAGSGTAGSGTAGTGTAGSGTAGSGTAGSGTAGSGTAGSGAAGSGAAGTGAAVSGTAGSGTAGSGTAGSGTAGSGAAGSGAAGSGSPSSGAGSQAQRASENGMASGSGNAEANDGQPGSHASGTASGSAGTDSASADAAAATASSNSISSKADKTVSWLQEHTLGVITGVLALIVLIIAWLLRRANSVRNESSDGVITEAMVQEKLNQIDLDFAEPPAGSPRSPDR